MVNQNAVRGVVLSAIALCFGLTALRYPIGSFAHAGAGLFPLLVSALLLLIGVITLVQARFEPAKPIPFAWRNIGIILLSLVVFVVAAQVASIVLGIVLLVMVSSLAATSYSWKRVLAVSVALIAVALAFQKLLGLNLQVI
ncbi:tripartite tricarboxylate transporter TctB family protein [Methylobacterium sp. E-005]|uniref:tripartite tricarboxylate transporter TctB family protein n=1 Tax=Methylobacterium sp. E-005 TaxID=2836549 RepID=UPI001FBBB52D|nr:tripartite tricarboxylate transporter TctB family protein [Methylobacterium sp. E-005]MCJ2087684.1 tripartite tricarboxylate transporter TctB family protein [Methylobacterium sp. E-005]